MPNSNQQTTGKAREKEDALLVSIEETLSRLPCQFFACEGPTMRVIQMVTCFRCHDLARVRHRLGLPIRSPAEEQYRQQRRRELRTHLSDGRIKAVADGR